MRRQLTSGVLNRRRCLASGQIQVHKNRPYVAYIDLISDTIPKLSMHDTNLSLRKICTNFTNIFRSY